MPSVTGVNSRSGKAGSPLLDTPFLIFSHRDETGRMAKASPADERMSIDLYMSGYACD